MCLSGRDREWERQRDTELESSALEFIVDNVYTIQDVTDYIASHEVQL